MSRTDIAPPFPSVVQQLQLQIFSAREFDYAIILCWLSIVDQLPTNKHIPT